MSSRFRTIVVVASAALLASPLQARAESPNRLAQSDSRWDPWLGCWDIDTSESGHQQTTAGIMCVVPVAGSHAVEALTIARGKIVARDRLDASGEPHAVSGQGCRGFETIDWSVSGRRALIRSDYVCGSAKGASSTIYAIAPGGGWLRIEQVRSGGGVTVSVERRRPIPLVAEVSAEAARAIDDRRMAISTARAAAAAPITTDEIVEAIHVVDAGVVRTWIVASGQSFDLDGASLAWLIRADVPQSVLDAMMPSERGMSAPALESQRSAGYSYYNGPPAQVYSGPTAYANASVSPQDMGTTYACPSMGCNGSPNPYSILNGYGVNPYGYPYSPFSTFSSGFPGGVFITNSNGRLSGRGRPSNGHQSNGHQSNGHQSGGRPPNVHTPVVVAPVGRRR